MLHHSSLHQAETAAAQRIQELDSYLREVRSCGTRSAIVAVPGTFISINTHKEHAWQIQKLWIPGSLFPLLAQGFHELQACNWFSVQFF